MRILITLLSLSIYHPSYAIPSHAPKYKCTDEVGQVYYLIKGTKIEGTEFDWSDELQLATPQQFLTCMNAGQPTSYKIISDLNEVNFTTNMVERENSLTSLQFSRDKVLTIIDEINEEFEELQCVDSDQIDPESKCD